MKRLIAVIVFIVISYNLLFLETNKSVNQDRTPASVKIEQRPSNNQISYEEDKLKELLKSKLLESYRQWVKNEYSKVLANQQESLIEEEPVLCEPKHVSSCHQRCHINGIFTTCGQAYEYQYSCAESEDSNCGDIISYGDQSLNSDGLCISKKIYCKEGTERELEEEEYLSSNQLNRANSIENENEFFRPQFFENNLYIKNYYSDSIELALSKADPFVECILDNVTPAFLQRLNVDSENILEDLIKENKTVSNECALIY